MNKDWTGNTNSIFKTLGASNHTDEEREENDFYSTDPKAVELLLTLEKFHTNIWEPACGQGHISEVLKQSKYIVYSTDIIDRGYNDKTLDFLSVDQKFNFDIITNPPYSMGKEFVEKSMEVTDKGRKIAMFLKLQFLEGQARREMFKKYPPKTVYVSSSRLRCYKNGIRIPDTKSSAIAYCWFIWENGFKGDTIIKWFN